MNAISEFITGHCTNKIYCALASAGEQIRVPVGGRFVCPYCGKNLVDKLPTRRIGLRAGMFIGGGMGISGLAMFAAGALLFGPVPPKSGLHLQQTADARGAVETLAKQRAAQPGN